MKQKWLATLALAVLTALSACTSMGKLDTDAPPPANDHAYFLIGVEPADVRISVFKGDVDDGWFTQNPWAAASYHGNPDDGFALGETHAGTTLGITLVQLIAPTAILGAGLLQPCGGARTIVFTAPMGKVIYVGSVRYVPSGGSVRPVYGNNLEAARAFLTKHYPQLAASLEQGSYKLMPAGPRTCGP